MKYLLVFSLLAISQWCAAQTPAEQLANRVAKKMKDSLGLTDNQQAGIYSINMQLHQQKQIVFEKYKIRDSIRVHLQRIENSRDTLYSTVLPPEKYLLYKQKKTDLVYKD